MQSLRMVRRALHDHLVRGNSLETFATEAPPETVDLAHKRIQARLVATETVPIKSSCGRYLNNFCIGSDPEFVFADRAFGAVVGQKRDAFGLGLRPGVAAGCDQNRRLAELKGWPTPSVLEHVASLLSAMRWLYRIYPETRDLHWICPPVYQDDGIGGHVHFGRKRPNRVNEIRGLDALASVFYEMPLFHRGGWQQRRLGDSRGQRYGMPGDIRLQRHGYEYRTLPSWLQSPALAFIVITASKLAVLEPDVLFTWGPLNPKTAFEEGLERLRLLADRYAGRDDDAWLMRHILARPETPPHLRYLSANPTECFRRAWGLQGELTNANRGWLIPPTLEAQPEEVLDLFTHLFLGQELTFTQVEPNFVPVPPKKYIPMLTRGLIDGLNRAGAGDLVADMVCYEDVVPSLCVTGPNTGPLITQGCGQRAIDGMRKLFPNTLRVDGSNSISIRFPCDALDHRGLKAVREFMYSGCLPVWRIQDVTPTSYDAWRKKHLEPTKPLKERIL